mgnify:CR=1 FL=1
MTDDNEIPVAVLKAINAKGFSGITTGQVDKLTEIAVNQSFIKIVIGLLFFLPFYGILLNYLMKKIKKG